MRRKYNDKYNILDRLDFISLLIWFLYGMDSIWLSLCTMIFASAVMCLALNVYWEARDQPLAGQIAVAQVVVNRANDVRYPDTVCEVVYDAKYYNGSSVPKKHKCQFSWFCDGLPDEPKNKEAFEGSVLIARAVLDGKTHDLTNTATHYHSVDVNPTWSYYYKKTIRIDDHIFYKRGI